MLFDFGRKFVPFTFILFCGLSVPITFASNQYIHKNTPTKEKNNPTSYLVTLSAGPAWTNGGETQTFYLQPDNKKTYTADNNTSVIAAGELFFGMQHTLNALFQGQIGLAIATVSNVTFSGTIWDDANPNLNNYTYTYTVQHSHLAVKGKLLMDLGHALSPYISASVGAGYNQARNFIITPSNSGSVAPPGFLSHTQTNLTYTLGIGMQTEITNHWQVGVGYEFANWGKNNLAAAPGQTLGQGLALNHFYTQQMQFSLSYTI